MHEQQSTLTALILSAAVVVLTTTEVARTEPFIRQDLELAQQTEVVDWICDEIFSEGICEML